MICNIIVVRLQFILARLLDTGLLRDCEQVSSLATLEQIQTCHTEAHSLLFGTDAISRQGLAGKVGSNTGLGKI